MAGHDGGQNPDVWLAARRAAGRPDETWRDIPGWPHQVSDQGRVRNARGRILTQRPNGRPKGAAPELQYRLVDLCANGEKWTVAVHVLVLTAFEDLKSEGQECRHLYGNPAHNWWPEGITWGDAIQQAIDKARMASYHTPEAKARRSDVSRRARAKQLADVAALRERDRRDLASANASSPKPGARMWHKVTTTLRGFLAGHRRSPITAGQRPPITEGESTDASSKRAAKPPVLLGRASSRKPVTEGDNLARDDHDAA